MKVVILAGGGGTRLFPLSRTCFPKQFLKVGNEKSLLEQTVSRFLNIVKAEDILVVTNKEYLHHVKNELAICNAVNAHIILEPVGRNTAPAIALAMKYCIDELSCNDKEVFAVTPADHVIKNVDLSQVEYENIDISQAPDVTAHYRVRAVPTLILLDEEENEIKRFVGTMNAEALTKWIE